MSRAAADLLDLYRTLYLVRRCEEAIQAHYAEDEMKTPVHLAIGQEQVAVGVCAALEVRDRVLATYRNHGVYLSRTGDTDGFFAELYGKDTGAARGKAGSMHLSSPEHGMLAASAVVGTTIPLALGAAWAALRRGTGARVCAFFGDGAVDEGVFWESLNFACLRRLPVLFVCEDNGLAIHARPEQRHGYENVARVAERFECRVHEAETADAAELRDLTRAALAELAVDGRPAFLHLRCYRFVEHVGPGVDRLFDLPHRRQDEFESWAARDPVAVLRARSRGEGTSEEEVLAIERQVDEQVLSSLRRAQAAPFPPLEALHDDVFA